MLTSLADLMITEETAQYDLPTDPGQPQAPACELELGDGSRLVLESAAASPIICRLEGGSLDLEGAMRLDGQPFAGFRRLS